MLPNDLPYLNNWIIGGILSIWSICL